jgi:small subunit ribosomal protein S4e
MHLKRQKTPKSWPIYRKGTAYIVRGKNMQKGIPVLIIIRDMLKIAKDRREAKIALNSKKILLNGKIVKDEKNSATLLDVITVVPSKEHYRLILNEKGKFAMEKEKEEKALKKISKVENKKMMKNKKIQLNLLDGRNFLSDIKCRTNDSVIINLKDNKIEKCLELKEKSNALVIGGKHSGMKGTIIKVDEKHSMIQLKRENGEDINVLIKQIMVIE